ncbi:MAG: WD40/YVTN/BNR-like repeat-containing protein [Planctomycetota bacterium]|jgi:photosystem II stability/assembly factor-like uncharacterized protein
MTCRSPRWLLCQPLVWSLLSSWFLVSAAAAQADIQADIQADTHGTYTDPKDRLAWYQKHVAMKAQSPFANLRWQFLGPTNISGRVTDVAVARDGSAYTIYVAAASGGVWKSSDSGKTWKPVFTEAPTTSIGDVTLAPGNKDIVWIGTGEANIFRSSMAGCGVYKSVNGGATFEHMGLAGTHTIPRIVIHPKNPDIVYVASSGHEWTDNPERGVYKTNDGGKTWKKVLFVNAKTGCIDLVMDPTRPDTLYAATWQRIRHRWHDPRNHDGYDGSGIYKTTDGGRTWRPVHNGLPKARWRGRIGIDLCQAEPDVVYAFVDNYQSDERGPVRDRDSYGRQRRTAIKGATVYRSDDGAGTWHQVSQDNKQMARMCATYGWVFGQMRVDPKDPDVIYVMGLALNVSRDSGKTFGKLGGMHGDHHALWIDPDDTDVLINGNDGGANISRDGGRTWEKWITQLPLIQFYNVAYDMAEPFRIYGSIQDHGSRRAIVDLSKGRDKIPAQDWAAAPGGEASTHAVDPTDANIVYSEGFYGSLTCNDMLAWGRRGRRPRDGEEGEREGEGEGERRGRRRGRAGVRRVALRAPAGQPRPRGQWLAPFLISPHDHKVVYHGMNYLYKVTDAGRKAERISPDLTYNDKGTMGDIPFHTIWAISESPLRKDLIYVGTDDGRVHVTHNGGKGWREIMAGIPRHRWVSRMVASRYHEGTVYMAQNGKRHDDFAPYLFRSNDYGRTWTSIVANIPSGPINVIREDPKNKNVLYVGTDLGVYVTTNRARTWHVLGANLPSTFVHDLVIHPRDDILVIATHGRGMFAMDARPIQTGRRAVEASGKRRVIR